MSFSSSTRRIVNEGFYHLDPNQTSAKLSDETLYQKTQSQVVGLPEIYSSIFNIQLPPLTVALDGSRYQHCGNLAAETQETCEFTGCGCVRRLIETYQPLLSLHAYTHGRRNEFYHIGRTLCLTPGNSSSEGLLSAFLITLDKGEIMDFQPIQG